MRSVTHILVAALLWLLLPTWAWGQTVLNGSFEQNRIDNCGINLTNDRATDLVEHLYAFGGESELDMLSEICSYGPAQDGAFFIALNSEGLVDAFSLALSDTLLPGRKYALRFFQKLGEIPFTPIGLDIGASLFPDQFGELVYEAEPAKGTWTPQVAEFQLNMPAAYLSVRARPGFRAWIFADHFSFVCPAGPDLGRDTVLCKMEPQLLEAGPGYDRYLWQDGSTGPRLQVDAPGQYWVEVMAGNCLLRDTLQLAEHPTQCQFRCFPRLLLRPTTMATTMPGNPRQLAATKPIPYIFLTDGVERCLPATTLANLGLVTTAWASLYPRACMPLCCTIVFPLIACAGRNPA